MTRPGSAPLGFFAKLALAGRIVTLWARVLMGLHRYSLPALLKRLGRVGSPSIHSFSPDRLSRAVDRVLQLGPFQPRCIIRALVLYRLLRGQNTPGDLVIGLPDTATDHLAHAWIEIDGVDIGPRPGRGNHRELVRYP